MEGSISSSSQLPNLEKVREPSILLVKGLKTNLSKPKLSPYSQGRQRHRFPLLQGHKPYVKITKIPGDKRRSVCELW